jgi:tRNA dimethylallyltransferase
MLIVICGATATGKSGLAVNLAKKLNSIIISADSRQVYREFDIGTAKPSLTQRNLVTHYLIDSWEPTTTLTLGDYQQQVKKILRDHFSQCENPPILVGGTGLYIKSIVKGLKIPPVSPQLELRSQLSQLGQKHNYGVLSQIDPLAVKKIHPNDQIRTLRALEVFYVTGKPISLQQGEDPPSYPIIQIGLDCPTPILNSWIEKRTHEMITMGLVEEVKTLEQKYGMDLPLLKTLGYGEIQAYLRGNISLNEAIALIVIHTRQFAKRQRTWFRADPTIKWFDATNPYLLEDIVKFFPQYFAK